MNTKSVLLITFMLSILLGCGEPSTDAIPIQLGHTWRVTSINDTSPSEFLKQLVIDDPSTADLTDIIVGKFQQNFTAEGKWNLSIKYEVVIHVHDVHEPLDPIHDHDRVNVSGNWSGTYSIADSILSLVVKDKHIEITADLKGTVPEPFAGEKEAEQKALLDKFDTHFFTPFSKTRMDVQQDTLTLTAPVSSKLPAFYDDPLQQTFKKIVLTRVRVDDSHRLVELRIE